MERRYCIIEGCGQEHFPMSHLRQGYRFTLYEPDGQVVFTGIAAQDAFQEPDGTWSIQIERTHE